MWELQFRPKNKRKKILVYPKSTESPREENSS
jgi:hypothetical protein